MPSVHAVHDWVATESFTRMYPTLHPSSGYCPWALTGPYTWPAESIEPMDWELKTVKLIFDNAEKVCANELELRADAWVALTIAVN